MKSKWCLKVNMSCPVCGEEHEFLLEEFDADPEVREVARECGLRDSLALSSLSVCKGCGKEFLANLFVTQVERGKQCTS